MNTHTPGPWHILPQAMDCETEKHARVCNPYAFFRHIATHTDMDNPECCIVADMRDGPKANAHLIVAAPDLLAALERIIPWAQKGMVEGIHKDCVAPNDLEGAINQAQEAIAKARGGS